MSSDELAASLIAERDQSVAALPYHDEFIDEPPSALAHDDEEEGEEEGEERAEGAVAKNDLRHAPASAPPAVSGGAPATAALHSPLAMSSARGSCAASMGLSEHPLCPASWPGLRAHVFLAANDDITPSASIHAYLSGAARLQKRKWGRPMLSCTVFPAIGHAEALFHPRLRKVILDAVQNQPSDRELQQQCRNNNANVQHSFAAPV
jgi:hypothetical protein